MRKLILICLLLLMVGLSTASNIESEDISIDIAGSNVNVEIEVTELTTESLTYSTSHDVENLEAHINEDHVECEINRLQVGSVIECPTEKQGNFTANLDFDSQNMVESRNGIEVFQYRKTFSSLTEDFRKEVILPEGTGIVDEESVSEPVILPTEHDTGSTGRQITVSWDRQPSLGESVEFQVMFEEIAEEEEENEQQWIYTVIILFAIGAATAGLIAWKKINRPDIENLYDNLSEDEIQLLDLLRDNNGEILQKDAVNQSDYSKAKISEVVSSLEEKEIITKEKEGRSNMLKINNDYKY